MNRMRIQRLQTEQQLPAEEWVALFSTRTPDDCRFAAETAREITRERFGNRIFVRGLIEFSNYCKNDCYYCGIRRSNAKAERYRLDEEQILDCCQCGYQYGFRTFVLQGGEDGVWNPKRLTALVKEIRSRFPDCAITLSAGEFPEEVYRMFREAGADRYLLRHETADPCHYNILHPAEQSWEKRMACLRSLKSLGFQTGCGFMVGSPGQTPEILAEEMTFLHDFQPQMVGIGPFIPHKDTPFAAEKNGSVELTLFLLSLIRIQHPAVLLPATTALETLEPNGRGKGILAGANVIMPNLSPEDVREKYMLYDNKYHTGLQGDIMQSDLQKQLTDIGYTIVIGRGDF